MEKSHSKSVNRFIYKQVWDLTSISRILGCCSCDTRFRNYTCVGGHFFLFFVCFGGSGCQIIYQEFISCLEQRKDYNKEKGDNNEGQQVDQG